MRDDPLAAAGAALDIAGSQKAAGAGPPMVSLFDETLQRLAAWVRTAPNVDHDVTLALCDRWQRVRQNCPLIEEIRKACAAAVRSRQECQAAAGPTPMTDPG
jgi:hypothetical protein